MKNIFNFLIVTSILSLISCETTIRGCMDENADNYNEYATDDDYCLYSGCTDEAFLNYNPNANVDDGSCQTIAVLGCIDENYIEYNPDANIDDGSCEFILIDYTPFFDSSGSSINGWSNTGWSESLNPNSCLNDEAGCIYSWGGNSSNYITDILSKSFIGVPTNSYVSFWITGASFSSDYLKLKVNGSIIWDVSNDYFDTGSYNSGFKNVIVPLNQSGNLSVSFESTLISTASFYLDEISILTN